MDKIWWLLIVIICIETIIFTISYSKIKSELDKFKRTIQNNIESNQKDISSINLKLSSLDSKINLTNENISKTNDDTSNRFIDYEKQLSSFKEQLAIFTEIESDSKQLNTTENELISNNELDIEQRKVFSLMDESDSNLFVTGKAGTGKSFLLKYFVEKSKKKTIVLAPTGISALNAGGVTIHSAFGWYNLRLDNKEITNENLKLKSEKRQVLKNVQTIIIDEISMVRVDILEKIDKILKILNNNDSPFGGKQMLLFGDLFQLPPIANKEEIKFLKDTFGGKHFFFSKAYKLSNFIFIELTINHRQKGDATFFEILNNIREGNIKEDDLTLLNSRTNFKSSELRRVVQLFPRKEEVDSINQKELEKIPAKEFTFKSRVIYNEKNLTFDIEKLLPISETLKLKLGALVMMVTNDPQHRWVNGTLAIISNISEKCIMIKIDGYEHEVLPITFKQYETIYEDGKIIYKTVLEVEQYPVVLAYAITIHKSQGMTYQKIACDVSECFETGQIYVALSRCTNITGLYLLKPINRKMLGVESEILEFYNKEREKVKT